PPQGATGLMPVVCSHDRHQAGRSLSEHDYLDTGTMKNVLWVLFVGTCAFLGGRVAVHVAPRLQIPAQAQQPAGGLPAPPPDVVRLSDRFETVARRVMPAVVYVEAAKPAAAAAKARPTEDSGSGVLVRLDGQPGTFVLTNNHVVAQARPDQITLSLA